MATHLDDPVFDLAERVASVEPQLPELTRQRVLAGIHARIELDERRARTRGHVLALALVSAAGLLFALWLRPEQPALVRNLKPTSPAAPAAPAAVALVPRSAPSLRPYLVSGADPARAAALLAHAQTSLSLAAGEHVLATLADHARLALLGPAELRVSGSDPAHAELELLHGTLLGDYDHARGGTLSVRAAGAVSEIVGTVFEVHAEQGASRTAVLHGTVRVRASGHEVLVHDGQVIGSGDAAPAPLSESDAEALRALVRTILPPSGEHGTLVIAAPSLQAELDGRLLAATPLWLAVTPGTHQITLRGPGQRVRKFEAEVRAGAKSELEVARVPEPAVRRASAGEQTAQADAQVPEQAPSASELYGAAEAAMRNQDHAQARALLAQLVEQQPSAPELDLALFELAELSLRAADYGAAETWLTRLERLGPRPALAESAHSLRCRLLRVRNDQAALARCIAQFQARFPGVSPR